MSSKVPQVKRTKSRNDPVPPKLRKNRKLELRWGNDYYDAVNKAVFSNEYSPYMPSEPPASIKENVDKTGYVCKQCKDCFRFLSSIEEHTSRRSWILGYWCQTCFTTKCTHVAKNEPMCSACRNVDASRHAYLADKGMRRNLKKAVTRIFYNQCQFFAHLRIHGTTIVDLSEVMLMPLPSVVRREDYGKLDRLCRALMETMFIRRIHIMDWFREMNIAPNRWNTLLNWMESKKKNPITDIIGRYADNCLNTMDLAARTREESVARRDNAVKATLKADTRVTTRIDEDPLEESNECPNDIAFVDCGPTPCNAVISEFPEVNAIKDNGNERTVERANSLWRSFSQQYDRHKEKSRETCRNTSEIVETASSGTSINSKKPRVLTIRSPKSLSITTIMKHFPVDTTMSTKNIIVVSDDTVIDNNGGSTIAGTSATSSLATNLPLELKNNEKSTITIAEVEKNNKTNTMKNSTTRIVDAIPKAIPLITKSQSFSEQMSLHGRIVFQNGRKYIIRHMPKTKTQSLLQDSIVKKIRQSPSLVAPITGKKIPLLPKPPPPPPPSSSSSFPVTKITATLDQCRRLAPNIRNRSKVTNPSVSTHAPSGSNCPTETGKTRLAKMQNNVLTKCREFLMTDLLRAGRNELETYIRHLREINELYSRTMSVKDDAIITNNNRAIKRFEEMAKFPMLSENTNTCETRANDDIFERRAAREWEKNFDDTEKSCKCGTCERTVKPSNYIVGVSLPAKDETIYCRCYNDICYICDANQGSLVQLKAHVKWHKAEKPHACPSCLLVFPTFVELEIHVWTVCFHPMMRYRYGCAVCEIDGIRDMESMTRHYLLVHARRKIICSLCKIECSDVATTSRIDYTKHFAKHHRDVRTIVEPKRLLVCNLKQCVTRPELFRSHLSNHIGISKFVYYKCPFCATIMHQATGRSRAMIRQHIIDNHLNRMCELVSGESLPRIIDAIKVKSSGCLLNVASSVARSAGQIFQVTNDDPTGGPKILDARTITPATFEHAASGHHVVPHCDAKLPKILEVRSEAIEKFTTDETRTSNYDLEIIPVTNLIDVAADLTCRVSDATSNFILERSSDVSSCDETKMTIRSRDEPLLARDDESTEFVDLANSPKQTNLPIFEANYSNNSSCSHDSWDIDEREINDDNYITGPQLKELLTRKRTSHRPWRIALNSPTDIEIQPIIYNCHLCGELINTSPSVIKQHFDAHHSSDYEIFTVSPNITRLTIENFDDTDYRDHGNDNNDRKRRAEATTCTAVAKRRKRCWGPKRSSDRAVSPSHGICVKPEPVEEIEGTFRCKKCDEPFDDRTLLRQHIAMKHRIKGQYLVCLECGENFVVAPSLRMHLKALHGIEDPITYLTKNTAYAPEILDDTEEDEKATESNQCYVCMAVFADKAALDKHMRVHGMAFLRRKRFEARKALKICPSVDNTDSSTKNVSIDEKSQNNVKLMKNNDFHDDDTAMAITKEKSRVNHIQEIETIMEIEKIEPLPIT